MRKKIVIASIALLAFAIAFAGNSWAARERGGNRHAARGDRFQATDNPVERGHFRGRGGGHSPRRDFVRPGPRFKHKYFKRHHYRPPHRFKYKYFKRHHYRPPHRFKHRHIRRHPYRAPHRFHPKFRHWRHRPLYRHGHHGRFRWGHRPVVKEINSYYSSADDYALPAEAFGVSASVSDSGFSVSVGASRTH